ncbi:MAG: hypothetical protein Q8Q48_03170 [Candidatus Staskawiczbacteria bacterium]|nr:hypothetical protein [Candidatus Staskawiczbacteria bacterium]
MKLKIIIFTLIGLSFAVTVGAVSLKVAPSSIQIEAVSGKTGRGSITIENPGSAVALFEVYMDDFSDWVATNPSSFTLNPGEKREVSVYVDAKGEGVYGTLLSVVSKPLSDREFKANAGVKIPVEIKVSQSKPGFWQASILGGFKKLFENQSYVIYALALAFIAILFIIFIIKRKNKEL